MVPKRVCRVDFVSSVVWIADLFFDADVARVRGALIGTHQ
jgi:hypothetical protein